MRTKAANALAAIRNEFLAGVAFYRRYDHDGVAVDLKWMAIGSRGCGALYRVWVKALNDGVYNRIELMLVGGNVVIVRKLSPEAKGRRDRRKMAQTDCKWRNHRQQNYSREEQNRLDSRESR